MSRRRQHPCVTPSKRSYPDLDAARAAYEEDLRGPGESFKADHAYRCMCGAWHRTKRREGNHYVNGAVNLAEPS